MHSVNPKLYSCKYTYSYFGNHVCTYYKINVVHIVIEVKRAKYIITKIMFDDVRM